MSLITIGVIVLCTCLIIDKIHRGHKVVAKAMDKILKHLGIEEEKK